MDASRSDRPNGPWLQVRRHSYWGCGLVVNRATWISAMPVANGSMVCVVSNESWLRNSLWVSETGKSGRSTRPWVDHVRLLRSAPALQRIARGSLNTAVC